MDITKSVKDEHCNQNVIALSIYYFAYLYLLLSFYLLLSAAKDIWILGNQLLGQAGARWCRDGAHSGSLLIMLKYR